MARRPQIKEDLPQIAIDKSLQAKFGMAKAEANQFLIERIEELSLMFVGLISGKHVMFVGPPGTAKSRLMEIICRLIQGRIYNYQFNKYTVPEEVFGPLDIPSLIGAVTGKSQFVRVTTGMLPEADVAHFDELGKASTAIRNTLLKILNEGEYDCRKVPLLFSGASANEWIGEGDDAKEMGALFDRFTIRKSIKQISSKAGRERLLFDDTLDDLKFSVSLSPAEVLKARSEAMQLPFTARCKEVLHDILEELPANGIVIGDRRQRWAVSVARAAAYLAGNDKVEPENLEVLTNVLWAEPIEQPTKAYAIIMKKANPAAAQITKLLGEAEDIVANTTNTKDLPVVIASSKKLDEIREKLEGMKDSDRKTAAVEFVVQHTKTLKLAAVGGL
jgi:MoxR-like ATPase